MKVKDLIARLKELNPNHEVVMSRDEEGNSFSHLYGLSDDCIWNDIGVFDRESPADTGESCIVLWPDR
jgi:hypothetical protein